MLFNRKSKLGGKSAPLATVPGTARFIANIVLSVLVGFGLYALGFETMDLRGSLIYGASMGAVGISFAALTCPVPVADSPVAAAEVAAATGEDRAIGCHS